MKKLLGIVLYHIGDLVSYPMCKYECCHHIYPFYNWCMIKSSDYNSQYWEE